MSGNARFNFGNGASDFKGRSFILLNCKNTYSTLQISFKQARSVKTITVCTLYKAVFVVGINSFICNYSLVQYILVI